MRSIALDIRNTGIYCGAYGVARVMSCRKFKGHVQITKFLASREALNKMGPYGRALRHVAHGPLGCTTHQSQELLQVHLCAFRTPEGL